jgi:hypothetical protein
VKVVLKKAPHSGKNAVFWIESAGISGIIVSHGKYVV